MNIPKISNRTGHLKVSLRLAQWLIDNFGIDPTKKEFIAGTIERKTHLVEMILMSQTLGMNAFLSQFESGDLDYCLGPGEEELAFVEDFAEKADE